MAQFSSPLRFIPFLRPLVWGGRKLAAQFNRVLPTADNYGESWEICDHAVHSSVVAAGPFAGKTLHNLLERYPRDILGPAAPDTDFPWLIKYLDARDWLSVQVHPNDALAKQLRPGEMGKTEAWFVLSAEPGSKIYAGLRPGVGPDEFRQGLVQGTVAELLHSFTPRPGDCIFLPAGTVHALGGGIVLAEVQQNSDVTFRLFDWNRVDGQGRPRQLHVEEGLAAIDWNRGPVLPLNVSVTAADDLTLPLVHCAEFDLSFFQHHQCDALQMEGAVLRTLIILAGQAQLGGSTLSAGEVWLVPACLSGLVLEPRPFVAGLLCVLPSGKT